MAFNGHIRTKEELISLYETLDEIKVLEFIQTLTDRRIDRQFFGSDQSNWKNVIEITFDEIPYRVRDWMNEKNYDFKNLLQPLADAYNKYPETYEANVINSTIFQVYVKLC